MNTRHKANPNATKIQEIVGKSSVKVSDSRKGGKKSKTTKKTTSKSYPRSRPVPMRLGLLIERVNALKVDLLTIQELWGMAKNDDDLKRLIREQVERIPEPAFQDDVRDWVGRYLDADPYYVQVAVPSLYEDYLPINPFEAYEYLALGQRLLRDIAHGRLAQGTLSRHLVRRSTLLAECFDEKEKVEFARIRECAICKNIFWAGRKDLEACPGDCARSLTNHRYHKKYLEKYKQQRIQKQDEAEKQLSKKGK